MVERDDDDGNFFRIVSEGRLEAIAEREYVPDPNGDDGFRRGYWLLKMVVTDEQLEAAGLSIEDVLAEYVVERDQYSNDLLEMVSSGRHRDPEKVMFECYTASQFAEYAEKYANTARAVLGEQVREPEYDSYRHLAVVYHLSKNR